MIWRGLALLGVTLAGCVGWETSEEEGLIVFRASPTVGLSRKFVAGVPVLDGDTSMLLTLVAPPDVDAYTARIRDPDGEVVYEASEWWTADRNKTNGGFSSEVVTIAWPIDAHDPPLRPGTWTIETRTVEPKTPVDVTVVIKRDADLTAGALVADVVWSGGLENDPDLADGVRTALSIWRDEVYPSMGVALEVVERTWDGADRLASPGFGDRDLYLDAVGDKALRTVSVLLVRDVTDGANVFGVAGGIPGPLVGTDRSAVLISVGDAAGRDGTFSAEEERLLSETIAHEVGHYLGLYHPAELPVGGGDAITTWDSLPDTPECERFDGCAIALGDNLMFPTPLCATGVGLDCTALVRQTMVTTDQLGVVHRSVLVE